MKKTFNFISSALMCLVIATTLSIGVATAIEEVKSEPAKVEQVVQAQEAAPVVAPIAVEDSLKICKDEQGQPKVCEDQDLVKHLLLSLGGMKGASALAIAFAISKLLLLLLLSPFFTSIFPSLLRGDVKLLVATGLNLVVGVLSLMIPPVSLAFGAAILHSTTLALLSVFVNQAYKQFLTAKGKS